MIKYQDLFDKSADAQLIIRNGMFVECNQATVDMLRFENKEQVLNTHPSELSPELQPDGQYSTVKADAMMAQAIEQGNHRFEWNHLRADGEVFPVEVLLTSIASEEDEEAMVVVWRDISEFKENQRFQEVTTALATELSISMDMHEIAETSAQQIRQFFDSDAIAINYIDHEAGINRGLYTEDTLEGEDQPRTFKPLSTSFKELDADSVMGIPKPSLLNRTPEDIAAYTMDRPFGSVDRKSASLMFAPIMWNNKKMGEVTTQSYSYNKYSHKNLEQLETLAAQIGVALFRTKTAGDLKAEHRELRKHQAQLLISQKLANVGSWEWHVGTGETYGSEELYAIFDIDPEKALTLRRILRRIHPGDIDLYKQEMRSNILMRTDYRIIKRDGSIRWIHEEFEQTKFKEGKPLLLRGCAQDITTQKESERRLAESDSIRELLLDIITHDMRNPVSVLCSTAELAVDKFPQNELISLINGTSQRLLRVLEETTILTQATFGDSIPMSRLVMNTLLDEVLVEFKDAAQESEVEIETKIPERLVIYANPLINEVFKNYVSNALKYATDGKRILIEAKVDPEAVYVSVNDYGETIKEIDRERIFRRKVQLSQKENKGHGVGLAIVKRIAAAHGAKVWVEPNTPRGNRFFIRIPLPNKD